VSEKTTEKFTYQYIVVSRHFVRANSALEAREELDLQTLYESDFASVEVAAIWDEEAEKLTGEPQAIYENPLVSRDEGRTIELPKGV
jgi:hypothetical protein